MKWFTNLFGGRLMEALTVGTAAPDFTLNSTEGKPFSLKEALARGPVVAAFFKISCPVCQYTAPFLERVFKASKDSDVTVIGISQDNLRDTRLFMEEFGVTFPVVLDDTTTYPVSNAYQLTNVPSIFWIAQDGEIEISSVGWSRKDFEDIHRKVTKQAASKLSPLFKPGEDIRDFRAG
jgi:peroxiredoxin